MPFIKINKNAREKNKYAKTAILNNMPYDCCPKKLNWYLQLNIC